VEKLVFSVPALGLIAAGKTLPVVGVFAIMDLLLGAGFLVARNRTPA